jgi:hypothetical protein
MKKVIPTGEEKEEANTVDVVFMWWCQMPVRDENVPTLDYCSTC